MNRIGSNSESFTTLWAGYTKIFFSLILLSILHRLKLEGNPYIHDSRKDFTNTIYEKFKPKITSPWYLVANDYAANRLVKERFIVGSDNSDYNSKNHLTFEFSQTFENDLDLVRGKVSPLSAIDTSLVFILGSLLSQLYYLKGIRRRSLKYEKLDWFDWKKGLTGLSDCGQRLPKQFWGTMNSSLQEIEDYFRKVN